jgi:alcohol dehydrogenase class IV
VQAFFSATRIVWEHAVLADAISTALAEIGSARPVVIVDAAVHANPIIDTAMAQVRPASVEIRRGGEPETDEADELAMRLSDVECDAVVGIGGGSVLDLAKALGGLVRAEGRAADYQGFNLLPGPALPIVAVPTTAGTGSEVTGTAVLVNRVKELKLGINSPHIVPAVAILEPGLLLGMPRRLTLSAGMDALSHTIESYSARRATEFTRALSVGAYRLLTRALGNVLDDEHDLDARRDMLVGSAMAGLAAMNAGTGAAHAMAYPLGLHLGVPHSEALTMLLPQIVSSCSERAPGLYGELAASSGGDVASALGDLVDRAGVRLRLRDYGNGEPDVLLLAAESMKLTSAVENHPVSFSQDDALAILHEIT